LVFNTRFRKDLISNPVANSARIGVLSITGAIIIVLIGLLGTGIYFTSNKILRNNVVNIDNGRIPKAEQLIRDYFEYTNRVINGDKEYNKKLWNLYTNKYQEERKEQFSHYNLPDELNSLYTAVEQELLNFYLLDKNNKVHARVSATKFAYSVTAKTLFANGYLS
jgi:hypothetical protein